MSRIAKPSSRRTSPTRTLTLSNEVRADQVAVRMYRQGLGDCFLITFPGKSCPCHMLIDCGVILGTANAGQRMQAVMRDIQTTTQGHLDVVLATHEHWDHLSGFLQAKDLFDAITIGEVWLAWTEDRSNALAQQLRARHHATAIALREAGMRLRDAAMTGATSRAAAEAFINLMDFGGPLSARDGQSTNDALSALGSRVDAPRYCRPGQILSLPDVGNVRVYILGPPEDEDFLFKSDPCAKNPEVYELVGTAAFLTAIEFGERDLDSLSADQRLQRELGLPFDPRWQIPFKQVQADTFFRRYYGFGKRDSSTWRHIDVDWLNAAGSLALQLDSDTNNTSLVVAIELIDSGKVLLFAADAQVGNWLSWGKLAFQITGNSHPVTAADLLSRTVLYKVGHHASHNATLRGQGLELMTSDELVAMIPVDEDVARNKKHWNMPFPSLLNRLGEKTRGRIVRLDQPASKLKAAKPDRLTAGQWAEFCSRIRTDSDDELYLEYTI